MRSRHDRGRGALSLAVAGVLALGGCAATPGTDPLAQPTVPAGVSVELAQLRADVAPRQAQVRVVNRSAEQLVIGDVRVQDARFDGPATRVVAGRTSTVRAGGGVDIRVQLPPVSCGASDEGQPVVVLEVIEESGTHEIEAAATDPLGFVAPLHARECLRERLSDAATLAFTGFQASAPGEPAALELTVTPAGGAAATIAGVQGTNLLDFGSATVDGAFPLDLEVGEGEETPIVITLPIVPFRCDPHAVQEDKRGTIFDVRVEVAGEPGEIELFVGDELRGRILSWVAAWCGFGG